MNEHEAHWRSLTPDQRADQIRKLYGRDMPIAEARERAAAVDRGLEAGSHREQVRAGREILGGSGGGLAGQMAGRHAADRAAANQAHVRTTLASRDPEHARRLERAAAEVGREVERGQTVRPAPARSRGSR